MSEIYLGELFKETEHGNVQLLASPMGKLGISKVHQLQHSTNYIKRGMVREELYVMQQDVPVDPTRL